ncbi:MAG: hypothetical protein RIR62_2395 [Pseudomonadota bacterium]|jgi:hypothetical protein
MNVSAQTDRTDADLRFTLFRLCSVRANRADLSRTALRSVLPTVAMLVLGVVLARAGSYQPATLVANAAIPALMAVLTLGWVAWLFRSHPQGRAAPFDLAPPVALAALAGACIEIVVFALAGGWHGSLAATLGQIVKLTLLWTAVGLVATGAIICICALQADPHDRADLVSLVYPAAAEARRLTLAGREIAEGALVMLEARGNSVQLVTVTGRETIPGPLADRIAELPDGLGRLIHRSVWVAAPAVRGYSRKGRDVVVELAGGQSAVAASSRLAEVLPWLRSLTDAAKAPE